MTKVTSHRVSDYSFWSKAVQTFKSLWHIFNKYVFRPIISLFFEKKPIEQPTKFKSEELIGDVKPIKLNPKELNTKKLQHYLEIEQKECDCKSLIEEALAREDIDNKVEFFTGVIRANFKVFGIILCDLEGVGNVTLTQVLEKLAKSTERPDQKLLKKCFYHFAINDSKAKVDVRALSRNILDNEFAVRGLLKFSPEYLDLISENLAEDVLFAKKIMLDNRHYEDLQPILNKFHKTLNRDGFIKLLVLALEIKNDYLVFKNFEELSSALNNFLDTNDQKFLTNKEIILNCIKSDVDVKPLFIDNDGNIFKDRVEVCLNIISEQPNLYKYFNNLICFSDEIIFKMLEKNIRIIDYVTFSDENKWIDLLDATPPNKKGFALIHILPKLSEEKRLKIIKDQSLSIDSLIELGESQKINESLKMFENWLLLLEQLELSVDLFSKIIDNGFLYKADNIKALTKNINFDTFFKNEEFITKLLQQYTSKDEVNVDEYAKTLDYLNSKLLDKSKSIGRIIRMHKTMLGTKRSLKKFTSIMLGD